MIGDFLKQALTIERLLRYPNKPFIKEKDVSKHSYEVVLLAIILADWEQHKFGNAINWEKLMKSTTLHDIGESVTGDILPYIKNIDRKTFNEIERQAIEDKLIKKIPESWQDEYRQYILNPKSDSIEGKIVAACDKLAAIEELTEIMCYLNPKRNPHKIVVEIIQETLLLLMNIDLDSCKYFLKYTLQDWNIEEFYPPEFKVFLKGINFKKEHFENKNSIKK